jgi:GNAT superfamily N-acetyltransferase
MAQPDEFIRPTSIADLRELGRDLFEEHWEEVSATSQGLLPALDVAWSVYERLEARDHLLALGLFVDGKLLGYSVGSLFNHAQSSHTLVCSNDALFVAKPARRRGLGRRLIEETAEHARALGCKLMLWHAPPRLESVLLQMDGYQQTATLVGKVL